MNTLPHPEEIDVLLSNEDLEVVKQQYENDCRPQTKFNYAWALVRSRVKVDQREGIRLFHEIYKDVRSRRREVLYYLALAEYKCGDYQAAKSFSKTLLELEPTNAEAKHLETLIDSKVKTEGLVGMAIVGAVAAFVGIGLTAIVRRRID